MSFDDLDEDSKALINTHDGWGRMPVDQKTNWNVEAILEQRNRLAEQLEQREAEQRGAAVGGAGAGGNGGSESNIWTNEPNTGTNIWEQSRDSTAPSQGQAAPYWAAGNNAATANRSNNANSFGNEQWRGCAADGGSWDELGGAQRASLLFCRRGSGLAASRRPVAAGGGA